MQSLRVLMSFHTRTIRTLLFVTLFGASVSFATPPVSPYTPGTTLDPLCTPGSTNCTVQIIPAQTGNTNKLLTTSGSVTSWTDTLTGISLSGATNTLSNIPNSALTNSTISINGTPVALGGSVSNLALTTAPLSQFAATTSSQLAGVLSDETGTGSVVYSVGPTLTGTLAAEAATFSGAFINTATTPAVFANAGPQNYNRIELRGGTGGTAVNWAIEKDNTQANALQFTPSTVDGGTTYTTPTVSMLSNGRVGIGISAPDKLLHIRGGSDDGIIVDATTGFPAFWFAEAGVRKWSLSSNLNANSAFIIRESSVADRVVILPGGNVGIGTSSPNGVLEVAQTSGSNYFRISRTGFNTYGFSSTNNGTVNGLNILDVTNGGATRLFIDNTGKIGIGTFTPARIMTINAGADSSRILLQNTASGATIGDGLDLVLDTSGNSQIWNYENGYLAFATNNTERARITNDGNVGIGTDTPGGRFHVVNNQNASSAFYFSNTTAGTAARSRLIIDSDSGTGSLSLMMHSSLHSSAPGEAWVAASGVSTPLILATIGTERMRIDTSGNVSIVDLAGIGNRCVYADANGQLNVKNDDCGLASGGDDMGDHTATQNIILGSNWLSGDGGNEGIRVTSTGFVGIGTGSPNFNLGINSTTGDSYMQFTSTTSGTTSSDGLLVGISSGGDALFTNREATNIRFLTDNDERMRISPIGNVGIGTTNPSTILHLERASVAGIGPVLWVKNSASSTLGNRAALVFSTNAGDTSQLGAKIEAVNVDAGNGADALSFWTWTGAAQTEKMRITSGGNVGIGTTTPSQLVDVVGSGAAKAVRVATTSNHATFFEASTNTGTVISRLQSNSSAGFAGTVTSHRFDIVSNDIVALSATTNGNVGIGTTTATARLSVEPYTDGTTATIDFDNTDNAVISAAQSLIFNIDSTNDKTDRVFAFTHNGTGYNNGTSLMQIQENGNVGVGTTDPDSLFELSKVSGGELMFVRNDAITTIDELLGGIDFDSTDGTDPLFSDAAASIRAFAGSAHSGTDNAGYLTFFTKPVSLGPGSAPLERLRIDSNGNVGIGTSLPSGKLSIAESSTKVISSVAPGTSGIADFVTGGVGFRFTRPDGTFAHALYSYDTSGGVKNNLALSSRADLVFQAGITGYESAPERMRITEAGNVGIGTASPALQSAGTGLHINASSSSEIKFTNNTTGALLTDGTALVSNGLSFTINNRENGDFVLGTNNTERIRILAAGNVGIGTSSPSTRAEILAVAADLDRTLPQNILTITSQQNNAPYSGFGGAIVFKDTMYNMGINNSVRIRSNINYDGYIGQEYGGSLAFDVTPTVGGAFTEAMRIKYDGSVGIGTTNPLQKLHIIGPAGVTSFASASVLGMRIDGATSSNDYSGIDFSVTTASGPRARIGSVFTGAGSYLQFGTSNNYANGITNTAMTIDYIGNVGVGTTTPGYRFQSNGPVGDWSGHFKGAVSTGNSFGLFIDAGTNASDSPFMVRDASANVIMRITGAGNVGIGTTSPFAKFHVFTETDTTSETAAVKIGSDTEGEMLLSLGTNDAGTYTYIQSTEANIAYRTLALNPNGGNIGIGIASAASKLHVSGGRMAIVSTSNANGQFRVGNTSDAEASIGFFTGVTESTIGGDTPTYTRAWMMGPSVWGMGTTKFGIGNLTDGAPNLVIEQGGNVAIGTSSPSSRLTVNLASGSNGKIITMGRSAGAYAYSLGIDSSSNFHIYDNDGTTSRLSIASNGATTLSGNTQLASTTSSLLSLSGNTDNAGYAESGLYFTLNNTQYWEQFIGTTAPDTMNWYSYTASTTRMSLTSGGTLTVVNLVQTSDARLKRDIVTIDGTMLDKIITLRPVTYKMNDDTANDPQRVGFIAQEVQAIFPEIVAVGTDENQTLGINYTGLIPYITKAIQEMSITISALPTFEDPTLAHKVAVFLEGIAEGISRTQKVETDQLCIGSTCVTEAQLQQLLQSSGQASSGGSSEGGDTPVENEPSTLPDEGSENTEPVPPEEEPAPPESEPPLNPEPSNEPTP